MFVYAVVCNESLKLYVGQHSGGDLKKYLTRKFYDAYRYSERHSHLYGAMRKYPRESWSIWPLVSGIGTRAELDELEKHFIRVLKAQHPDIGYNICDGGQGRTGPISEEQKKKQSQTAKRLGIKPPVGSHTMPHTKEAKRKMSEAHKKASEETRERISGTLATYWASPEGRERAKTVKPVDSWTGRRHKEISRQRQSESRKKFLAAGGTVWNKGKQTSDESKKKMSLAKKGKPWTAKQRAARENR